MFMLEELLQRAREEYQNAIMFYQAGRKNDFYRYLGSGEAYERLLRENYELTYGESQSLEALTDICDEYDDRELYK